MKLASGTFHQYSKHQVAFEFDPIGSKKVLIFVGGLFSGLASVPYLPLLASKLSELGWTLIQIQFSSSLTGWGTGSLQRDSEEISQLVEYLRSEKGGQRETIGLMGHSTGCQNTIHYLTQFGSNSGDKLLDFGILQAPVSDRVAFGENTPKEVIQKGLEIAKDLIDQGRSDEFMTMEYAKYFAGCPISAYRYYSLMAVRGDDDYFSPDLTEKDFETTFGKLQQPLLILYSGCDEFVPEWLNKEELLNRWIKSSPKMISPLSKIVKGGIHDLGSTSTDDAPEVAVSTAVEFIKSL